MKTRLSIYVVALACLTIAGAGNAQAFTRIGPLNNMHGHRTAPSNFHSDPDLQAFGHGPADQN